VRINILISLLFVLFSFFNLNAQTYNYSYTDPCTGNVKNIIVPINGSVTVGYYGFVENFTQQQFTDGTFETWANQVFSQYDGSPCSEIVGLGGQINIAQDVTLNTVGLLNSLSSLMDLSNGATDFLSGSLAAASNSSNTGNNGNKKNGNSSQNGSGNNTTNTNNTTTNNNQNQINGTSNTNEGSQTTSGTNETSSNGGNGTTNQNGGTQNPTPAGGTTTEGGSNENGNQQAQSPINPNQNGNENNNNLTGGSNTGESNNTGSSGNVEGSNQQEVNGGSTSGESGGNPPIQGETTTPEESSGGQTNITQGATKTINQNKEGGKPTVIASSDFVGFNFQNSEVRTGLKLTGGYHNMRWDGETARGGLVDYVSAQKGPNLTGYHAWINKKSTTLLSGTLSLGFEGRGSVYGTIAGGQMLMFPKIPSLKVIYMGTVSYGQVYKTEFLGTAVIAGGMYDLKFGKRIDMKIMGLFVYSPYISYYNDLLLKSPYVIIPSLGTNINITKRFKFNINAGGAWALKESTLNYTVTCGTRLLVGQ
jgi:hypothetical protein